MLSIRNFGLKSAVLTVLGAALLLSFGCKKEESKEMVAATNDIYSAELGSLTVRVNGETLEGKAQVAIIESTSANGDLSMKLDNIIKGYDTFLLPCTKQDNVYSGETTVGNRSIKASAKVNTDKQMELNVEDRNTVGFTDTRWMIAATTDRVPTGSEAKYKAYPDVRLRTNIGEISLGKESIDLQESFAKIEWELRQRITSTTWQLIPDEIAEKFDIGSTSFKWISVFDYLVFGNNGKVGLGVDQKHAASYFKANPENISSGTYGDALQTYEAIINMQNPLSGERVADLFDVNSDHCITDFYEGTGLFSGLPVVYFEGGWAGETLIKAINDLFTFGLYSSANIPLELKDIPVQVTCNGEEMVLQYSLDGLIPVLKAVTNKINSVTWQEFKTDILPGWSTINDLLKTEMGITADIFTEENLNLIKSAVNAVYIYASQKGRELSLEAHFVPFKKEIRPWEDPKK